MTFRNRLAQFGPGLLYAGAAVGVSHLVQSTRAGAEFGFQLAGVVLLVNIIKYPIFEAGPRYAAATGTTLLEGYKHIGKWAVLTYMILSVLTMFIIMAAISIVTAGLFGQLAGFEIEPRLLAVFLLATASLILGFGKYHTLDRFMKVIIVLLTFSTIMALILAWMEPTKPLEEYSTIFDVSDKTHLLFLVALIGWMPAPIDISVWHSVWSVSKMKVRGGKIDLKSSLTDFNVGYWGTTLLALSFLSLGALVLYGSGLALADNSVEFSGQLVAMYTLNIGQWAFPFIALAAFTTMFSTLLTCLDAFPRTLRSSTKLLLSGFSGREKHRGLYWFWIILTATGTSIILLFYLSSMREMVDLATTISFVVAPVLAILNYLAINSSRIPESSKQPRWLNWSNMASIGLLILFSIWFLLNR